ncbi:uncharacterized protein LOC106139316 [Amyelois transitella]|uniref:uncharacterized protein LOC106139316 n=1 Tax=Amyelois transitella TaxID=680683 RepID=UPI0029903426|nr:uncharacterized protein LOC106139316 [Amyelois transitella]
MKIFAFAFVILLAGVGAVPSLNQVATDEVAAKANARFIEGIIADAIGDVAQGIRDAGLDPLNIEQLQEVYRLPVTDLVNIEGIVENLSSTGLSNIIIENANYGILTSRLRLTVALPRISVSADAADVDSTILGWNFRAGVSGSLEILEPRVAVDVRIQLGIISGISIRSLDIDFSLGGIESDLSVSIQGNDYSNAINTFAGETLPNALANHRAEINELLEFIVLQIAEDL